MTADLTAHNFCVVRLFPLSSNFVDRFTCF